MILGRVFDPNRICVNIESEDKEEVFEELVNIYVEDIPNSNRARILDAIIERERKMSTGIKRGVAVPHGKISDVDGVKGVVGISRAGIDYDALDGAPVHIIFLLLSSDAEPGMYLRILKRLAQLLDDPAFYEALLSERDAAGVYKCICKFEDVLASNS